jgi:transcriptional regulator with XRE-family HTH domain
VSYRFIPQVRYSSCMDQAHVVRHRTLGPLEPTQVIAERVAALRRYRGWTQQDLADAMQATGIDIERIVIAKLESGRRSFVKVDELLALCLVLEISPTDLLVPKDVDDDRPYLVTPRAEARAVDAREWVRGEGLLFTFPYPEPVRPEGQPVRPGGQLFASPRGGTVSDPTLWMPADRAERVASRYEYDPEDEEQDQ